MALVFQGADGDLVYGKPTQLSPEGLDTGWPTSSTQLTGESKDDMAAGAGGNYAGLYNTQPAVRTAVDLLTHQFVRGKLLPYERGDENARTRLRDGALSELLYRPAKRCGPVHLKQWMIFPALLHGNSTTEIIRNGPGGRPIGFQPLPWTTMDPQRDPKTGEILFWWHTERDGKRRLIMPEDVLHVAWYAGGSFDAVGTSPLAALKVTLAIDRMAQRYQLAQFRNGVRPSGGVTLPEAAMANEEMFKILSRQLRHDLDRMHAGVDNAGRPVRLPPGAKWETFAHTAVEVELIEQRKLNKEEVNAVYFAPGPLAGDLEHATYSNITELRKMLFGETLDPWYQLARDTFKAQVIDPEPSFRGQFVDFDLTEVLRGDPVKEATAIKTRFSVGGMTINDVRAYYGLPKIDHPDCDLPMILAGGDRVIGREPTKPVDSQGDAVAKSLSRWSDRLYRKAKAGDPASGWEPERFERELTTDLEHAKATDPTGVACTWASALNAVVGDAMGDPDRLKASLAALHAPAELTTA